MKESKKLMFQACFMALTLKGKNIEQMSAQEFHQLITLPLKELVSIAESVEAVRS